MGCTVLTTEDWVGANQMRGGKSCILSKKPRWQIEESRDSLADFLRSLNSTDRCFAVGCDGEKQQRVWNLFVLVFFYVSCFVIL